jgi:hypothetical protein
MCVCVYVGRSWAVTDASKASLVPFVCALSTVLIVVQSSEVVVNSQRLAIQRRFLGQKLRPMEKKWLEPNPSPMALRIE